MPVSVISGTTGPLAYNATATEVRTALESLTGIAPGDVVVTETSTPFDPYSGWQITFQGNLANQDIAPLQPVPSGFLMSYNEIQKGGNGSNEIQRLQWNFPVFGTPTFTITINRQVLADVPEEHMALRWVADTLTSDPILQALVGTAIHPDSVPTTHPALAIVYSYQVVGQDDKGQGDVPRGGVLLKMTIRSTYKGSTYPKALEAVAQRVQELLDLQRVTTTYDTTTAYITCDREQVTTAQEETATDTYMHNIQVFDIFVQNQ
jgi:hypothetical protein